MSRKCYHFYSQNLKFLASFFFLFSFFLLAIGIIKAINFLVCDSKFYFGYILLPLKYDILLHSQSYSIQLTYSKSIIKTLLNILKIFFFKKYGFLRHDVPFIFIPMKAETETLLFKLFLS
jgi:hypothetical protein